MSMAIGRQRQELGFEREREIKLERESVKIERQVSVKNRKKVERLRRFPFKFKSGRVSFYRF